jgi:hypothetical protein
MAAWGRQPTVPAQFLSADVSGTWPTSWTGKQKVRSSRSANIQEAKKLRDQILGKMARGELTTAPGGATTCGELLDDLLEHARSNLKASTEKIFRWCIKANIRPYFGQMKVSRLTTKTLKEYRQKRLAEGRAETTCNRELSILRIALNLGRKCTPPKVSVIPHFPMVREENARQGFLSDQQYAKLRDILPDYLRPLFVVAYFTGVRLGELLAWTWEGGFRAGVCYAQRRGDEEWIHPGGADRWRGHAHLAGVVP